MVALRALCAVPLLSFAVGAKIGPDDDSWFMKLHKRHWVMSRPELTYPPEAKGACKERVDLRVVPLEIEDPLTGEKVMTRSWNGVLPAPTFRLHPGCQLKIRITNELEWPNPNCELTGELPGQDPVVGNWTCYLNTSNIHTHGLHVSSNPPGDSIFSLIGPGSHRDYHFDLPPNHMAGTMWYHPHVHHSTAAQAGGGMAGALIIEDPEGSVPWYVKKMEERLLIFFVLDFALQAATEKSGNGTYFWQTNSETNVVVVNGMYQPKVSINSGKWYRFRMVHSAIELVLQMTSRGSAWCAMKLLAKDGVWLNVAPRDLRKNLTEGFKPIPIQLGPGNRADIAMACTCPFPWLGCYQEFYSLQNCTSEAVEQINSADQIQGFNDQFFNGTTPENAPGQEITNWTPCDPLASRRRRGCEGLRYSIHAETWGPLEPPRCGFGMDGHNGVLTNGPALGEAGQNAEYAKMHGVKHSMLDIFNGTIWSVVVKPSRSPFRRWWFPAWRFSVRRPCYLADMMDDSKYELPASNFRNIQFYVPIYGVNNTYIPNGNVAGPISMMYPGLIPGKVNNGENEPLGARRFLQNQFGPSGPPYGPDVPVGSAVQWNYGGLGFHPLHLHVTPFQIFNLSGPEDDWIRPGDWQDTIIYQRGNCAGDRTNCPLPTQRSGGPGNAYLRFWTNNFTGRYISHCHLLSHEDEGMMFYFNVSGKEGTINPESKKADPTCYTGYLKDERPSWGFKWAFCKYKSPSSMVQSKRRLRSARRHVAESDESAYLQEGIFSDEVDEDETKADLADLASKEEL